MSLFPSSFAKNFLLPPFLDWRQAEYAIMSLKGGLRSFREKKEENRINNKKMFGKPGFPPRPVITSFLEGARGNPAASLKAYLRRDIFTGCNSHGFDGFFCVTCRFDVSCFHPKQCDEGSFVALVSAHVISKLFNRFDPHKNIVFYFILTQYSNFGKICNLLVLNVPSKFFIKRCLPANI